jgi:uncharacterized protein
MTPELNIAKGLSLPQEAVTQTLAILGIRGSGKTNTAVVLAEELLKAKHQVVIIDPVDVWWGLKSSKDGTRPGYSVPVIGGDHADVPLDVGAGAVLADFVVDTRASVILALRHLSMNDQRRFAADFAKRLYDRKGSADRRSPLMLIVDEADEFVPQRLPHGHEAMFGAFDRLVRRGRSSGIGVTLISQRAQVLNKDVLSQMETLVGMRVLHKLDRAALLAWIEAHDTEGRQEEFLASLASLERGDAWIWSPAWLNVFKRVHIRERETFDSSATPKAGERAVAPKEIAPVDLEKLRNQMAAQIERAKADDPRELRKHIAALEVELRKARAAAPAPDPKVTAERESEIRKEAARSVHQQYGEVLMEIAKAADITNIALNLAKSLAQFVDTITEPRRESRPPAARTPESAPAPRGLLPRPTRKSSPSTEGLTGPEQRILNAIAWMESIGVGQPEQAAVAFLAGYTVGGGAFNNPRGALRSKGLVAYLGSDRIALTDDGRAAAEFPDSVLTTEELQRRVLERLPGPERRILEVILRTYPRSISNEDCARAAGYEPNGGAYNNPRGRLRSLGLIEYQSGHLRARDLLFLEAR